MCCYRLFTYIHAGLVKVFCFDSCGIVQKVFVLFKDTYIVNKFWISVTSYARVKKLLCLLKWFEADLPTLQMWIWKICLREWYAFCSTIRRQTGRSRCRDRPLGSWPLWGKMLFVHTARRDILEGHLGIGKRHGMNQTMYSRSKPTRSQQNCSIAGCLSVLVELYIYIYIYAKKSLLNHWWCLERRPWLEWQQVFIKWFSVKSVCYLFTNKISSWEAVDPRLWHLKTWVWLFWTP